jgi:hypothetical protein
MEDMSREREPQYTPPNWGLAAAHAAGEVATDDSEAQLRLAYEIVSAAREINPLFSTILHELYSVYARVDVGQPMLNNITTDIVEAAVIVRVQPEPPELDLFPLISDSSRTIIEAALPLMESAIMQNSGSNTKQSMLYELFKAYLDPQMHLDAQQLILLTLYGEKPQDFMQ